MAPIVGILSVLEGRLAEESKQLWQLFEARYASKGVQSFDYPNVTFQASYCLDMGAAKNVLVRLSHCLRPFTVIVDGLGFFGGQSKAVFLRVCPTDELKHINRLVNTELAPCCEQVFDNYLPEQWQPHITLAMEDLADENFIRAWADLQDRCFHFEQLLSNICLVYVDEVTGHIEIAQRETLR